ncbi:MAG TPA: hypothetical protein V6D18_08605 [Thermosynechococcaceae cyanobacterium]
MTYDVSQWLAEIKALKQQLATASQESEQAHASAANWRQLYETEAQQRRSESRLAQQTIDQLKQQIQQFQSRFSPTVQTGAAQADAAQADAATEELWVAEFWAEVEQLPLSELREKLVAALVDRDRLLQSLQSEQANHAQTRKSLTTALGDAIDLLSKQPAHEET